MLTFRDAVPGAHAFSKAEFATPRPRVLKIGARILETALRVRIAFAASHPEATLFRELAIGRHPPDRRDTAQNRNARRPNPAGDQNLRPHGDERGPATTRA